MVIFSDSLGGTAKIVGDNFFLFIIETICCDPSSNRLNKTVQMKGHNICVYAELTKIFPNYHQILTLI